MARLTAFEKNCYQLAENMNQPISVIWNMAWTDYQGYIEFYNSKNKVEDEVSEGNLLDNPNALLEGMLNMKV